MMLYEHKEMNCIAGAVSEGTDVTGPYEDIGAVIPSIQGIRGMGWPFPVFEEDKLYLLFGAQHGGRETGAIYASVMDFEGAT